MITRQLPPAGLTTAAPVRSTSHPSYDGPVTADLITLGGELGCPYLARLKAPKGAEEGQPELTRTGATTAALATVAGGLGMGAAAACCPRTSGQ